MRRLPRFRTVALLALLGCAVPAFGHHSFGNAYFESDSVTIDGDVIEFQYRAPHAWLHVQARDPEGRMQHYAAEWASPSRLERDGVDKTTFQYNDQVSVTGAPSRDASSHQIHLKKVKRFTRGGWSWDGPQGPR
jgi:NADH:ubiquinone oxidoreductase subunit